MKKLLAIILATALLVGMLPAVFAADGDISEQVSVTYTLKKGGRSDASTETWFERAILDFETDGETTTDVVRETEKNPAFTSFPEASTNPNDQWAYVGATNTQSSSGTTSTEDGTVIGIVETETNYLNVGYLPGGGWIAFKIKVPATANYEITGLSAYVSKYSSSEMKMYIVPKSEALNTTLTTPATYGNLDTTYSSGSTSKYYATRENTTSFTGLGISSDYLVGTANLNATTAEVVDLVTIEGKVTDKKLLFLEADTEYFLFLHNANSKARTLFISSITLSEPAPDVTYTFTKGGRSDASTETWFERAILDFEIDGETTTAVIRETEKNPAFTSFPEALTDPNDQWAYVGATNGMSSSGTKSTSNGTELPIVEPGSSYLSADSVPGDGWIAFKIKVPATANYEITGLSAYVFSNGSSETEVYIVPKSEALNTTLTNPATYGDFSTLLGGSSKYYVTRENAKSFANLGISSDYLVGTANLMGDANAVQDLITIDGGVKNKKNLFLEAGTEYFLFLHNANGKKRGMPVSSITLSKPEELGEPEDEAAEGKVSFAVTTNIPGEEVTRVESLPRGQEVDMTQYMSDNQNYKFIGWMRGAYTEDDAQNESSWITIGDTYNVWTNTFLTAVYEPVTASDEKAVEFWNQNGAYLGKSTEKTYATDVKRVPTLIGFGTFKGWFIGETEKLPETFAELKAGTTNAVAQYEASAISNVTFNGNAIAGADTYDAPVELDKDSETTAWLRDGEPIAYGKTYKFNVWDATNITEGTEEIEDKVPVAILDYSEDHKAYMLEYDAGAYDIVEAGIIFGKDTADIKKYTSQRKEKHHQFTVPEEGALKATGYIIYTLDGGANYKTKYVSVTTAN